MKRSIVAACAVTGIAAIVAFTHAPGRADREDASVNSREVARLRAHFDSVLAELEARDLTGLSPAQRAARGRLIRALAAYRDAGVFPHNHDFPEKHVPYIRDEHGTLCAMAYLITASGRRDIVDAVAARRNNAYVPELAPDPQFAAWLDSVGLTLAEAARVQPTYGPRITVIEEPPNRMRYALPSLAVAVPALIASAVNWDAPPEKKADGAFVVGALSGAAAVILGGAILADDLSSEAYALGLADLTFGAAALATVVRRSLRHANHDAARPPVAAAESRFTVDLVPVRHGDRVSPAGRVQLRF